MVALFDIHVIDIDAVSYSHRDILSSAEEEKKDTAEAGRALFTPIVVSVDGQEAECLLQLLADQVKKKYSDVADGYGTGCPLALPF